MYSILIVDDEKHTREGLALALSDKYDAATAANADEALRLMDAQDFDALVTDLRMSGNSGLELIKQAVLRDNSPVCIMMTAYGNIDVAVEAMKHGASDFLTKPVDIDRLELVLARALEKRRALLNKKTQTLQNVKSQSQNTALKKTYSSDESKIIGKSPEIAKVMTLALKVAPTKASVMITGETGTGKELVAEFIHKNSGRQDAPFVAVHCAAIPTNLLESELFGYEKGAFTGASARKIGRFEAANNGTLFLDEIGEIDASAQVKLLRFLETRKIERLGSLEETPVDIRLLCATNKDLAALSKAGDFREDLFYRLNVVELHLPALRERRSDIPELLEFYLKKYAQENNLRELKIAPDALKILCNYSWKGNIRELRNFCENAVVLCTGDTLNKEFLDGRFSETTVPALPAPSDVQNEFQILTTTLSTRENEIALIKKALEKCGGNKTKAAEMLGISRRTLHRHLKEINSSNTDEK